ncbi:hypothetical protein NDU88_004151 [Pleurodeles waltl]|uniref:Uncharacterized protein n=1 Tax=Pleurodeles waltl TaxID=8319 RepID=A0AAV7UEI6_PLEWA|nr:hypothetical protein NDU88_004151 [Pleurodeles waltl]
MASPKESEDRAGLGTCPPAVGSGSWALPTQFGSGGQKQPFVEHAALKAVTDAWGFEALCAAGVLVAVFQDRTFLVAVFSDFRMPHHCAGSSRFALFCAELPSESVPCAELRGSGRGSESGPRRGLRPGVPLPGRGGDTAAPSAAKTQGYSVHTKALPRVYASLAVLQFSMLFTHKTIFSERQLFKNLYEGAEIHVLFVFSCSPSEKQRPCVWHRKPNTVREFRSRKGTQCSFQRRVLRVDDFEDLARMSKMILAIEF